MNDIQSIKQEFKRRAKDARYTRLYSPLNPTSLYTLQTRERAILSLLRRQGITTLHQSRLLDLDCGSGGELSRWIGYGVQPANCAGIDLIPHRIAQAQEHLPASVQLQQGDASHLPYASDHFDIVLQYTVFSSILDRAMKQAIATEMLRVLRPGGLVIWYDFWWNPVNRQTRGIGLGEIKRLFPGCHYDARLITLAPPLARLIAPHSWLLAHILEALPLRTHWLVGIRT